MLYVISFTSSYIILFQKLERLLTITIMMTNDDHDDDESPHRFAVPRTNGREQEEVDKNQDVLLDGPFERNGMACIPGDLVV